MRPTLCALSIAVIAGTSAIAADPAPDDMKELQGVWQMVEFEFDGNRTTKDNPGFSALQLLVKGDEMIVGKAAADGTGRRKTFKLNPAKSPKELDLKSHDGQEAGQTAAGIYKLDKDRLTICIPYFTLDPTTRPKEFKTAAGDTLMIHVFERVKPN